MKILEGTVGDPKCVLLIFGEAKNSDSFTSIGGRFRDHTE